MTRTQIQLPDPLYRDLKRIASEHDWSLAEVIRRAGEHYVARFPQRVELGWSFPEPQDLGGDFLVPPEQYNAEFHAIENRTR